MVLHIKYRDKSVNKLEFKGGYETSNWIDLSTNEDVVMNSGDFKLIDLGIAIKIPKGYEIIIAPRSSTYMKYGIIQANSIGIIDESYCGDEDYIKFPAIALKDTKIDKGTRICQFRLQKRMENIELIEVSKLDCKNRGGFGSTDN